MTSDSERSLCLFRQMEAVADTYDGSGDETFELESGPDIERAFTRPKEFTCRVGGCAITGEKIKNYILAAGNAAPRQEIDNAVAPSCAVLDVFRGAE